MEITTWASVGSRNIALCADNRHGVSWVEYARAHSPVRNRILKAANRLCLQQGVDVSTCM